eukprot:g46082.t1
MKVDFFRKLGYSTEQIHTVFQKMDSNADTNTILGELVKAQGTVEKEHTPEEVPGHILVPRGGPSVKVPAGGPVTEEVQEQEVNLRTVVIDGSNVAMRSINHSVRWAIVKAAALSIVLMGVTVRNRTNLDRLGFSS